MVQGWTHVLGVVLTLVLSLLTALTTLPLLGPVMACLGMA